VTRIATWLQDFAPGSTGGLPRNIYGYVITMSAAHQLSLLVLTGGVALARLRVVSAFCPSRWRGWRPQAGDQCEDFLEHLSRHRDPRPSET
jgi:hypothetical protein